MFKLFMDGGLVCMSMLTVILVCVFFAAWKAPRWVKEIGKIAVAVSLIFHFLGLRNAISALFDVASVLPEVNGLFDIVSPGVVFGGLRCSLIPLIYGLIIYVVSLVITIIQKPRV